MESSKLVLAIVIVAAFTTIAVGHTVQQLDDAGNYILMWHINSTLEKMEFQATVKTSGYVGLGLNTKPEMDGADLFIGGFNAAGEIYSGGYRGSGHNVPIPDTQNVWEVYTDQSDNNGTHVKLYFTRALDTKIANRIVIKDSDMYVLWSIGKSDDINEQHESQGPHKVNLINPDSAATIMNPIILSVIIPVASLLNYFRL